MDVPKFLAYCKDCPNYNTRWSCPPFDFDPLEIWSRYDTLRLIACVLSFAPGQDAQSAVQALKEVKKDLVEELLALEQSVPGSFALSAGTCEYCERCGKADGMPCRAPERLRYSIEALGGDVGKTMEKYLQKPIRWIRNGTVPEYLTLVGGLLMNPKDNGSGLTSKG
ncbi:MAG: DUF2284 domain-containing protein [Clostridiales bacterium]|nr:DUF2284 domain-containing protein [Clostridiales bacterium]